MAKVSLPTAPNGYGLRNVVNSNFDAIEDALNNGVLWRDNPTGEPNSMKQDLDMDGNDLLNVDHLDVESLLVAGQNYEDTLNAIADLAQDEADRSQSYALASASSAQVASDAEVQAESHRDSALNAATSVLEILETQGMVLAFPLDLGFIVDANISQSYDLGGLL